MKSQPQWWLRSKRRPWPREGTPTSVHHLPWTAPAPFVSMATKQCCAHAPLHSPQAVTSSERSQTKCPVGRMVPNLHAQSFHVSQVWGPRSAPPPASCQEHSRQLSLASFLPFPEKAAAAALGTTWTARDLRSHFASLWASVSCLYGRPLKDEAEWQPIIKQH